MQKIVQIQMNYEKFESHIYPVVRTGNLLKISLTTIRCINNQYHYGVFLLKILIDSGINNYSSFDCLKGKFVTAY